MRVAFEIDTKLRASLAFRFAGPRHQNYERKSVVLHLKDWAKFNFGPTVKRSTLQPLNGAALTPEIKEHARQVRAQAEQIVKSST